MHDVLIDRAEVVRIHLDQLERSTTPDAPGVDEAVYASVALRFLIDDNALGSVARAHGITIEIDAPDFRSVPLTKALMFAAGGYPYDGRMMAAYYAYRASGPHSQFRRQYEANLSASPPHPPVVRLKLSKFLSTPCLAFAGAILSRETLVRYVANKCGGAHHHGSRLKFDAIDDQLTNVGHSLQIGGTGLSVVFLETLGTAWFLLKSPGVVALRAALP
jgi:hypothetical protein